jgi:prepilin-type processing-associated H-X9-DG protein
MKRLLILCGLLLCCAPVFANEAEPKPQPKQFHMEPNATLSGLVVAFNSGELNWLADYVLDAPKESRERETLSKIWKNQRGMWELGIRNPKIKTEGDAATAKFETVLVHPFLGVQFSGEEELKLRRRKTEWGSDWAALPLESDNFTPREKTIGALQRAIDMAAFPARALKAARAQVTLHNMKLLGLGIVQFVQDYDEKFDNITNDNFKERLKPYVQDNEIFRAPELDAEVGYFFNPSLTNKSLAELEEPAQTVMLFESVDGKLLFRHDERAAVAFADGHVKLITRDEAKNLRWKP